MSAYVLNFTEESLSKYNESAQQWETASFAECGLEPEQDAAIQQLLDRDDEAEIAVEESVTVSFARAYASIQRSAVGRGWEISFDPDRLGSKLTAALKFAVGETNAGMTKKAAAKKMRGIFMVQTGAFGAGVGGLTVVRRI